MENNTQKERKINNMMYKVDLRFEGIKLSIFKYKEVQI